MDNLEVVSIEKPDKIDVSEFFSKESQRTINLAVKLAKKKHKKIITPIDLALVLLGEASKKNRGKVLNYLETIELIQNLKEQEVIEIDTNRYVLLSPELQATLIKAYIGAHDENQTDIKNIHLLKALTESSIYKDLGKAIKELLYTIENNKTLKTSLNELGNALKTEVIGQDEAVEAVVKSLKRSSTILKDSNKPIGSFLFLGPTGVGKTQLCKSLAKIFFEDEKSFLRLDMSEYSIPESTQKLIGSPPGYIGHDEGGQLTNFVKSHPQSLILFDEIEKANVKVFDLFLQMIDDARLTDSSGELVNFKDIILIFTSNVGSMEILEESRNTSSLLYSNSKDFYQNKILPLLLKEFKPEFINRFEDIILFRPLGENELKVIAQNKLKGIKESLEQKQIKLIVSEETFNKIIAEGFDPQFGARPLERTITKLVTDPIAQMLIDGKIKEGEEINI